jgi:hypothetical protein
MDIGHVILGRHWLHDLNVIIFGRSNSCSFTFQDKKKIQFIGLPLRSNDYSQKKNKVKEGGLNIISPREFDKEICEESVVFAIVAKEIVEDFLEEPPEKVREVLKEFLDVFPFKLPDVLPHIITSTFKSSMEIVLFQWSQVFRHPDWRPYIDAWF